jgi:alpha-tubulin suppressor-like RCC1 family protein
MVLYVRVYWSCRNQFGKMVFAHAEKSGSRPQHEIYIIGEAYELGVDSREKENFIPLQKHLFLERMNVKFLQSGLIHTVIITQENEIICFGSNNHYRLLGTTEDIFTPSRFFLPDRKENICQVAAGETFSLVLTGNKLLFISIQLTCQ